MSAYKINASVEFSSNITKLVNQINSEVRKVSAIKIGVNKNDLNQIKSALGGISTSLNSAGRSNSLNRTLSDLSKGARNSSKEFKLLSSSINNSHNELEKFGRSTGATIRRFSAFIGVVTVFNGIKDAFRDSAKEAITFEKEMIKVAQVTGFALKDLGDLDREITKLSTSLGVSSSKLLNVSLTLAQAGITAKDTKKALDVLAKTELSATFTNIQDTTEAAIAVIAQFGTTTSDLEKQLGSINTVSAKFAVESGDLTTAIRKAGGAFQATGGDLNQLLALFTSVRATTRESADAIATGLRTIFTRLQRPRTLNFLEELGITLRNDKGEFIGVYNAVEKLSGALKNISGTDPRFNQIVEELGGFRQVSRVIPLLKEFETSQKALAAAQRAGNSVNEDAITAQKSLANQIARVTEEFNALVRSILNDSAIKFMITRVLDLASAFIKVADSLRPLIPLLGLAGAAFIGKNTSSFLGGVKKEIFDVKSGLTTTRRGFARGGLVPGSGSGDTVPAMLEPGEFVLRKSAVNALGRGQADKINRYANGGLVKNLFGYLKPELSLKASRALSKKQGLGSILQGHTDLPKGQTIREGLSDLFSKGGLRRSLGISPDDKLFPNDFSDYKLPSFKLPSVKLPSFKLPSLRKSLGISRLNPFSGDADYTSVRKPNYVGRGLENKKFNGKTLGQSEVYNDSLLASDKTSVANYTSIVNRKNISQLLKEFENDTGIDPTRLVNKVSILNEKRGRPTVRGQFSGDREITLFSSQIKDKERLRKILYHELAHALDFIGKDETTGKLKFRSEITGSPENKIAKHFSPFQEKQIKNSIAAGNKISRQKYEYQTSYRELFANSYSKAFTGNKKLRNNIEGLLDNSLNNTSTNINNGKFLSENEKGIKGVLQSGTKNLGKFDRVNKARGTVGGLDTETLFNALQYLKADGYASGGIVKNLLNRKRKIKLSENIPHDKDNFSIPGLTDSQNQSIKQYVSGGDFYPINNTLRGKKFRADISQDKIDEHVQNITTAIRKSKLKKNTILYRGIGKSSSRDIEQQIGTSLHSEDAIGKIFSDKGFVSASTSRKVASSGSFAEANLLKIIAKKNSSGLSIPLKNKEYGINPADDLSEHEVLFQRGSRFKILSSSAKDGIVVQKLAKGGKAAGTDTVPALLTPGEFVVNKKSAQEFGYDNLKKVNKYAKGGLVSKLGGIGIGGAIFGPQLAAEGVKGAGLGDISQLTGSITLAATALVAFSAIINQDTENIEEHIEALKEDINRQKVRETDIIADSSNSRNANVRNAQVRPFLDLKKEIRGLKEQRSGLEKQFNNPNQKIADLAFNKAIDIDSKIENLKNNFIQNLPNTRSNQSEEIKSLNQASSIKRETALEKVKQSRITLEADLVKKQKQILADKSNEKAGNIAVIGGGVALGVGAGISGFANANAIAGNRTTGGLGTSTVGAIGSGLATGGSGAIGGAVLGGQLGSVLGPHGAAILGSVGALVGVIYGSVTEFQRLESQLNQVDFTKKFDKFSGQLGSVLNGKSTPQVQRGNINSFAKLANEGFLTKTGDEFTTLKGQVGGSVDALRAYLSKLIEVSKSTDGIIKENEDLILVLSRFGNQSIKEVEADIKKEIETRKASLNQQDRFVKIQEENNRRLSAVFNIGGAIGDAQRSVSVITNLLDELDQFANGISSINSKFDFSALDNVGGSNINDVRRQATQAGNFIGGPGRGLSADVISATSTISQLPTLLNKLVNSDQFEGRDLGLELQDAFRESNTKNGKGQGLDFAQKLILEKFEKIVGGTGNTTEFLKRFNENPVDTIKELQSSIDPIVNALKDAGPKIVDQFDKFVIGLDKGRENFIRSLDGIIAGIDIEDVGSQLNSSILNKPRPFSEAQAFEDQRRNTLSGGRDVGQLGLNLADAQSRISVLNERRANSQSPEEFKDLTIQIEENVKQAVQLRKALEFSADVNTRLTNVQQEIEKFSRTRELKKGLSTDFIFGDAQTKRDITKGILGAGLIQSNLAGGKDPLQGLSPELKDLSRVILEKFSDSKVFNGKTGNEVLEQIAKAKGFDFKPGAEEEKTIGLAKEIIKNAKDANDILNNNLIQNNNKFITELGREFDEFFSNLEKNFADRENKADNENELAKSAKIAGIQPNIDFLKSLKNTAGINPNNAVEVSSVKNTVDLLNQARKIGQQIPDAANAGRDFKANPNSIKARKQLEAELGTDVLKTFDAQKNFDRSPFGKLSSIAFGNKTREEQDQASKLGLDKIIDDAVDKKIKSLKKQSGELRAEAEENLPKSIKSITKNLDELSKGFKTFNEGFGSLKEGRKEKEKIENRADGGMVWKKRGTDTVPAMTTDGQPYMLTPGEMVMNRRAVGKYGPQLKRMNYAADGAAINSALRFNKPLARRLFLAKSQREAQEHQKLVERSQAALNNRNNSNESEDLARIDRLNNLGPGNTLKGLTAKIPVLPRQDTSFVDSMRAKRLAQEKAQSVVAESVQSKSKLPINQEIKKTNFSVGAKAKGFGLTPLQQKIRERSIRENTGQSTFNDLTDFQKQIRTGSTLTPLQRKIQEQSKTENEKRNANAPIKYGKSTPGQGFFNVQDKNAQPASVQPVGINPKVIEDFNKAVDKLSGTKLELAISGSLSVNITDGALSDKVKEGFRVAVQQYTDEQIAKAVNQLINDANLAVVPRPIGRKDGK